MHQRITVFCHYNRLHLHIIRSRRTRGYTMYPPYSNLAEVELYFRPTEGAISTILHLSLSHLEKKDTYFRMLFINFSSAFNTKGDDCGLQKILLHPHPTQQPWLHGKGHHVPGTSHLRRPHWDHEHH